MTSTKNVKDPVAEIFAKLDAQDTLENALGDPLGQDLVAGILEDKAAGAARPAKPMAKPDKQDKGQGRKLAADALAGITSGKHRHELHRPKYGSPTSAPVPITQAGRLDDTQELVAGRSRRYAQDLEGWARAALADVNQRGVLVVWDGMFYAISLDAGVAPRTITELHRRDLDAWRARSA